MSKLFNIFSKESVFGYCIASLEVDFEVHGVFGVGGHPDDDGLTRPGAKAGRLWRDRRPEGALPAPKKTTAASGFCPLSRNQMLLMSSSSLRRQSGDRSPAKGPTIYGGQLLSWGCEKGSLSPVQNLKDFTGQILRTTD